MRPLKVKDTRGEAKSGDWGLWVDTVVIDSFAFAVVVYSNKDVVLRRVESMKVLEMPASDPELSDYLTARRAMERSNGVHD